MDQGAPGGIEVRLLGRFEITLAGRVVVDQDWPRRKTLALVKLLALQPGREMHREAVFDALWPERDAASAANNLRQNVHKLRAAFAGEPSPPALIETRGNLIALAPHVHTDVEEFRTRAAAARDKRVDAGLYERALAVYGGELLPEDRYEQWAERPGEELRSLYQRLLLELSRLYTARGAPERAITCLHQLVASEPAHEEAHRALMHLYAHTGARHLAIRQYEVCRDYLEREICVAPSDETELVHRDIVEGRLRASREAIAGEGPFIGRESELDVLRAAADEAIGGSARLVLLGGEPGIGKTRTAAEVAAYARLRGAQVLWGRCYDSDGAPAYWPWIQAVRAYIAGRTPDEARTLFGAGISRIAQVIPDVREMLSGLPAARAEGNSEQERFRFFEAMSSFLEHLARLRPVMLVIDDLHDADQASLLLLRFVARELRDARVLVLATYRDTELRDDHPLAEAFAAIAREPESRRVSLAGLPASDVSLFIQLATGAPPATALAAAVHHRTDGNPFFVQEVARLLAQEPGGRSAAQSDVPIPEGVREVVAARVRALTALAQRALTVASVLGVEFDLKVVEQLADLDGMDMLRVCDEATAARLIAPAVSGPAGTGLRFAFGHALVRDALYDRIPLAERAILHRSAGEAIETLHGSDSHRYAPELARHFIQAAAAGDPAKAIRYALRAGEADLAASGWEGAILHWEAAARLMEEYQTDPEELAALLERLETVIFSSGGHYPSGLDYLRRALPIRERLGQDERAAQIHSRLGRALSTHVGDPAFGRYMDLRQALRHYEAAEPVFATGAPRPSKVYFYAAMATTAFNAVRIEEGAIAAERACDVANQLAAPALTSSALLMRGLLLKAAGRLEDARLTLEDAYAIADRENVPSLVYYAVTSLADWTEGYAAGSGDLFEQELNRPRFAEGGSFRGGLHDDLINALCISGMLERARETASQTPGAAPSPLLAYCEGRWDEAERHWSEGLTVLWDAGAHSAYANRAHQLAELYRVRGAVARAEQLLLSELEIGASGGSRLIESRARSELAVLYAFAGRSDEAEAQCLATRAIFRATPGNWGRRHARLHLAGAILAGARGPGERDAAFGRAAVLARDASLPWDEAETHLCWAHALHRTGESQRAADAQADALAIYRRMGAGDEWLARARAFAGG